MPALEFFDALTLPAVTGNSRPKLDLLYVEAILMFKRQR